MDSNFFADYLTEKRRDRSTALDPAAPMLQQLDAATSHALLEDTPAAWYIVDTLFNAVLNYPGSRWDRETLNYRQRQLYFK